MQRLGFRVARRVRVAEKGKKDSGYAFTELGRDRFRDGSRGSRDSGATGTRICVGFGMALAFDSKMGEGDDASALSETELGRLAVAPLGRSAGLREEKSTGQRRKEEGRAELLGCSGRNGEQGK